MPEDCHCSIASELAAIKVRLKDVERRCNLKEASIKVLEAWQNKALGYALALSIIASKLVDQVWK